MLQLLTTVIVSDAKLGHQEDTARTPELKNTLLDLSKSWHKLAIELRGRRPS